MIKKDRKSFLPSQQLNNRTGMAADADTKTFMESFQEILQEINRPLDSEEDEEEEEEEAVQEPTPKKQKTSTADQLTNEEAVNITFAAFDFYIRKCDDSDFGCIAGAKEYGRRIFEKAQEFKAEYKERFDASSVVAAFQQLAQRPSF